MSTHNICFREEIRKISILNVWLKKRLIKSYAEIYLCTEVKTGR